MKNYCSQGFLKNTALHTAPLDSAFDRLGFLTALTVLITAAPGMAAENKITDLEIAKNNHQLELKLSGSEVKSSFYTLRGNNTIEANIFNTSLDLPEGNSFTEKNSKRKRKRK
ncbi:MAG: hypothetical protein AAFO95_21605 [Cyanobacteria bacterium J06600_6]